MWHWKHPATTEVPSPFSRPHSLVVSRTRITSISSPKHLQRDVGHVSWHDAEGIGFGELALTPQAPQGPNQGSFSSCHTFTCDVHASQHGPGKHISHVPPIESNRDLTPNHESQSAFCECHSHKHTFLM
jgi:hypothetical protein